MSSFRKVTDEFWVAPQISLADLAQAKADGFQLIVNNRPDGESPDQPASVEMAAEARSLGLDYLHAPVVGRPDADTVNAVQAAVSGRKTLAFCRSGTRSIVTWALGQSSKTGAETLVRLGEGAGYDLRPFLR